MGLTNFGRKELIRITVLFLPIIVFLLIISITHSSNIFCVLTLLMLFAWIAIMSFFRDPKREIPEENNIFVSPADGTIHDIRIIDNSEFSEKFDYKPYYRIGIFLSIFDVHINRTPCNLVVENIEYREGKYHDARTEKAIKENESNIITCKALIDKRSFPIIIKQISGAVAKKIIAPVKRNEFFYKGDKFGMIKFGSRTELMIPVEDNLKLKCRVGDKVKAGSSIIAELL